MSIVDKVSVNTHYTRSINLERDADSVSVVGAYIPTSRALRTLERMAESFKAEESPRAWSLVGPYGAGKSSFAVFLAHLLGQPMDAATKVALKNLRASDEVLAKNYRALTHGNSGYCTVLLTGSPESLGKRLLQSLAEKADEIWGRKRGRSPGVVDRLAHLAERRELPIVSEVLECVQLMQVALRRAGYSGLLLVIDELGKFLEYEARHYGANDIFLLQALAEHAVAVHEVKLSLVVMLHQSFEQYARGLGETLKNEWAKVQGRFENIPFLESAEQVLRVVAAAVEHDFNKGEADKINKVTKQMARSLAKSKALPGTMDEATAAELFCHCYPLHPVSALLLPILCQKVAQNERTLFSYLGSRETYGFQDGLTRCAKVGDWIFPWEIYEYFILNQPATLSDHVTHRRWAEVVTAIERLGDAAPGEVQLLKAIGLLNIIGAQGNFKASKDVVGLCLSTKKAVTDSLNELNGKSIVQYRKFSAEYRVWQGSDFDLDGYVEKELRNLGRFGLAERLNSRHSLLPIVARRYTIKNGALRCFVPIFTDAASYHQLRPKSDNARIIFYLAESKDDENLFCESVCNHFSDLDIVVLCHNGNQLREAVGELLALEEVRKGSQELNSDPVAQREFKDRYAVAISKEEELLGVLTDEPALSRWFWNARRLQVVNKRTLQEKLSDVLEEVFYASPVIKNELINRDKPSSQANAARNKLAVAMLSKETEMDLGFEKFPAEKAIYRAALRETKLHVQGKDGKWYFQGPQSRRKSHDPCNISYVWQRIEKFLDSTEQQGKSFIELNQELMAPPYGVKEGVLKILYLASLIANQQELAIYENRVYTPYLSEEQIERFLRYPDEFTVQRFRISGLNLSIYQEYSNTLFNDGKQRTLLCLAKPIAKFISELPKYSKTTVRGLSKRAQNLRSVFMLSKSPIQLMLEDIPKALDINLDRAHADEGEIKKLSKRLTDALRELKYCHSNMKAEFASLLAQAFALDKDKELSELRNVLCGRCIGLDNYTIDREGQKAFIQRIIKKTGDDDNWFDSLLMFLGHKQPVKWTDVDRDTAEYRLSEFTRKISDLEKLRIQYQDYENKIDGDFDVYLLRSIKKGAPDYDEVVVVDKQRHQAIKEAKSLVQERLFEIGDGELRLAALAEIVDEFLSGRRSESSKVQNMHKRSCKRPRKLN